MLSGDTKKIIDLATLCGRLIGTVEALGMIAYDAERDSIRDKAKAAAEEAQANLNRILE